MKIGNEIKIKILERVKESFINDADLQYTQFGICAVISNLYNKNFISSTQKFAILKFLEQNRPTATNQFQEFLILKYWLDESYWWLPIWQDPETRQVRINYLTKLIESLKNNP